MMAGDNVANGCFSGHLNDEEKDNTRYSFNLSRYSSIETVESSS